MSPRPNARRPADVSRSAARVPELAPVVVERAELREVAVGLLEVVAEDLLELDLAAALAVDAVGPVDEALVERRPGALEQAVVGGVADQDVVEAEAASVVAVGDPGARAASCVEADRCAVTWSRDRLGRELLAPRAARNRARSPTPAR